MCLNLRCKDIRCVLYVMSKPRAASSLSLYLKLRSASASSQKPSQITGAFNKALSYAQCNRIIIQFERCVCVHHSLAFSVHKYLLSACAQLSYVSADFVCLGCVEVTLLSL